MEERICYSKFAFSDFRFLYRIEKLLFKIVGFLICLE